LDTERTCLSWDFVVKQFENLVKYAAKQRVTNYPVDGHISAEDLYQEGMIKLYDCWKIWCVDRNKPLEEFKNIFSVSLFREVGKKAGRKVVQIDLEDIPLEYNEDVVEHMYVESGVQQLLDILDSKESRGIVRELIQPSQQTLYEVWADIKRKEMIKSQGKRVNIPKDNTVRMKHIIRSLGITSKQYDNAMLEIRSKAKIAFN